MAVAETLSFAIWPPAGSPVSLRTWWRELGVLAQTRKEPPPFPEDAARGNGEPVIVVPGFCAPDDSTARLRQFLMRQGFDARPWDCGPNLGPTRTALKGFERLLNETADRHGAPVALVGISLGGTLSREIAKRHSALVARVVTLASPIRLPVATPLAPLARVAAIVWDGDARGSLQQISQAPPVPLTAIVNPKDGIVDWRACVPDPAPQVEIVMIEGAHMTMGSNPDAQRVVAARLAQTDTGCSVTLRAHAR
jgi:pimeloyl-ACP methyl ester carboxylesterase